MTIRIDKKKALSLLRQAVKRKGSDYVHSGMCVYFNLSTGNRCMVGEAFSIAGVSDDDLGHLYGAVTALRTPYGAPAEGIVYLTSGAVEAFRLAQYEQDTGHTWGEALSRAKLA